MSQRVGCHGTRAEKLRRVQVVLQLLRDGTDNATIQLNGQREWNVSRRTIDAYLSAARAIFQEVAKKHMEEELGLAKERLQDLYGKLYKSGDFRGCLLVQRERNDLLGLQAPKRSEVDMVITDEMLEREIARLEAEIAEHDAAEDGAPA
jgi:hypothetical protein